MDIKVIVEEELKKGWEATSQLKSLISAIEEGDNKNVMVEPNELDREILLTFTENYCTTIIKSFDTCISILKQKEAASNTQNNSYKWDTPSLKINGQASGKIEQKMSLQPKQPRVKMIETHNPVPDRYLWRKYGQKPILHTKYPREYFRCAYRDDQKCQATKHVQKISDNPTKYKTIYYATHTCQPNLHSNNVDHINNMLEYNKIDHSNLISFESTNLTNVSKQVLKHEAMNSSPFRQGDRPSVVPQAHNNGEGSSTSNFAHSKKIMESSPPNDVACHNQTENTLMSQSCISNSSVKVEDYMFTSTDEKYFELSGAMPFQDLPLWEDDLGSYTYTD